MSCELAGMENVRLLLIGVPALSVTVTVAEEPFVLFRIMTIMQVVAVNTAVDEVGTAASACEATVFPQAVLGIVLTVPMTLEPVGRAFVIPVKVVRVVSVPESRTA